MLACSVRKDIRCPCLFPAAFCYFILFLMFLLLLLIIIIFPTRREQHHNIAYEVEYINCGKSIDVSLIVPFITYNCSINASCSLCGILIVWAMKKDKTGSLLSLIDLSAFHYSISSQEQVKCGILTAPTVPTLLYRETGSGPGHLSHL